MIFDKIDDIVSENQSHVDVGIGPGLFNANYRPL
jgi:hypothetical protein